MTFKVLLEEVRNNVHKIIEELHFPQVNFVVESAKPGFGDVTCNVAFLLSKPLKKKPNDIAKQILEKYRQNLGELVLKAEAHQSGYLNFFANSAKLNEIILKASATKEFGFLDLGDGKKVVVEHTSVNPNKALHIGHVRNVIIGDSIARILSKTNHDVKVLNYVDDSGVQVADIIVAFKYGGFSESPDSEKKFDHYCGDHVYVRINEKYGTEPSLQEKRKSVLQELESGDSEVAKFAKDITKKVLAEQLKTCWRLGAVYDCINFESQIIRSGLWSKIFQKMKEQNMVEYANDGKNVGCWVIKGKTEEDDKVVVRSDGTATYIAKDIPYAFWKLGLVDDPFNYKKYLVQKDGKILWETTLEGSSEPEQTFTGEKVITVIDYRQSRLQNIISDLISQFVSRETEYIYRGYESVTLSSDTAASLGLETDKRAQMSGRKGLYINADTVIDLLESKTKVETKKRNPDLNEDEIRDIARDIAIGTLRYEMIKPDLDRIINFDLNTSLSLEGDTAPYIQYSHARSSRILDKAGFEPDYNACYDLLANEYELSLVNFIGKFDMYIQDASNNIAPKVIAKYCYDLAVFFNSFYEHVKVLDSNDKSLVNVRLCLVNSFKSTLAKALELIGIKTPSRM